MSGAKVIVGISLAIALFCALPLAITSVVLGAQQPGSCDIKDRMGLDVGDYLLGSGISGIVVCVLLSFMYILVLLDVSPYVAGGGALVVTVLSALFGLAWFIVGAIILYRGNIECIKEGSTHVIYALVMWCLSALSLLHNCCSFKVNNNNDRS